MSYDLNVYLKRSNMPSPASWKAAINDAGFPVILDDDFEVDSFSGFLPCPVNGEISGFEYYASVVSPKEAREMGVGEESDFSVQFCFGSRELELVSALAASSVLASVSGGLLDDPQSGESVPGGDAVNWAKEQLKQIGF